ncbi:MAG: sugar phosphate isomerase/epimerase family protein, partial [Candidatus Acidiferrum sp.]
MGAGAGRPRVLIRSVEVAVYVACSTLCFGRHPFEEALRIIGELQFNKYDVAIHEQGPHLRPSQVVEDVTAVAARLRIGPGLTPAAFSIAIETADEKEYQRQFQALCRLARVSMVPLITMSAGKAGAGMDAEFSRLTKLNRWAEQEGILLTVATLTGTLTEDPDGAVALCKAVPGLGLTFDPSHYLVGQYAAKCHDHIYPYVRHVHLRDTGMGQNQFQVRVGQGAIEYGRVITQLERQHFERCLTVDIRD